MYVPSKYGLAVSWSEFSRLVLNALTQRYDGLLQPHELLQMPSEFAAFCAEFRERHQCSVPDDMVSEAIRELPK